jgi:hypothetical protein
VRDQIEARARQADIGFFLRNGIASIAILSVGDQSSASAGRIVTF